MTETTPITPASLISGKAQLLGDRVLLVIDLALPGSAEEFWLSLTGDQAVQLAVELTRFAMELRP